jgi:hypothetical protein
VNELCNTLSGRLKQNTYLVNGTDERKLSIMPDLQKYIFHIIFKDKFSQVIYKEKEKILNAKLQEIMVI